MRSIFFLILFCACHPALQAQVKWKEDSMTFSDIEWENYSTSYMGDGADSVPLLVTAIPYNGIYNRESGIPMNMSFSGSSFRFQSDLSDNQRQLQTYDSSDVYFLVPGVFPSNVARYEFRVLQDNKTEIRPWSAITRFTEKGFTLNSFKPHFAFLGGFSTTWDHFLVAELRVKGQSKILSAAVVSWQQTRPTLENIFTSAEMNEFLLKKKRSFTGGDQWASGTPLPPARTLPPGETSLIFFCGADIYKKTALEYRLLKGHVVARNWGTNEHDNNAIWLRQLGPGDYLLQMRYRSQRHNVTEYPFTILPAWYQGWTFRILAGLLLLAFFTSIGLAVMLRRQRRRMVTDQARKERHALELRSIHAQLNPHFIFNALSSIQGLVNKNDMTAANRYLSDFGSLVRSSLTDSHKEFIPLEREIHNLDIYCSLERLRFNFDYSIHCEEDIPAAEVEIPALLLQPLVENAVRHGIAGLQEKGRLQIRFSRAGKDLRATVLDNGAGFDAHAIFPGFGLRLTRDRIRLLNEMAPEPFISWTITTGDQGTNIQIVCKNWLS